jgi:cysteine synthase B
MPPQAVPDIGVSVLDLIGRTPLIRLRQFEKECPGVEICAKVEGQNPGGSVKDRAAARMIAEGEKSGALKPGLTILDATSGNTGIAYAMIGAARGYKVKLCVPANASPERKLILKAFGAELVLTDPLESTDGAIREARRLHAESPAVFLPGSVQQRRQLAGALRYDGAGDHRADERRPDALRRRARHERDLRRHRAPSAEVQQGHQADFVPAGDGLPWSRRAEAHGVGDRAGIYDPALADEDLRVESEDAFEMVRRLAREEGVMAGISSGAALAATLQVARRLDRGVVVTVFPDGAEKYLTEKFWTADA